MTRALFRTLSASLSRFRSFSHAKRANYSHTMRFLPFLLVLPTTAWPTIDARSRPSAVNHESNPAGQLPMQSSHSATLSPSASERFWNTLKHIQGLAVVPVGLYALHKLVGDGLYKVLPLPRGDKESYYNLASESTWFQPQIKQDLKNLGEQASAEYIACYHDEKVCALLSLLKRG